MGRAVRKASRAKEIAKPQAVKAQNPHLVLRGLLRNETFKPKNLKTDILLHLWVLISSHLWTNIVKGMA